MASLKVYFLILTLGFPATKSSLESIVSILKSITLQHCLYFDILLYEGTQASQLTIKHHDISYITSSSTLITFRNSIKRIKLRSLPFKFSSRCTIIISEFAINETMSSKMASQILGIQGSHQTAFYIFRFYNVQNVQALAKFISSTKEFLYVLILTGDPTKNIKIFIARGQVNKHAFEVEEVDKIRELWFGNKPDFAGEAMTCIVCARCTASQSDHKKKNVGQIGFIVFLFELGDYYNSTFILKPSFSSEKGNFAHGEWDDFMRPMVDGSAAISMLIKYTPRHLKYVYTTGFLMYGSKVRFITALPRKATFNSLSKFVEPFSKSVWAGFVISFFAIFSIVQLVIFYSYGRYNSDSPKGLYSKKSLETHVHYHTFLTLLNPVIDQTAFTSVNFVKANRLDSARFAISIWFLALIAIVSSYKCKMISAAVKPQYIQPPSTFEELANSHYEIGAVLYTYAVSPLLNSMNNSVSKAIASRTRAYGFQQPGCYKGVVKREMACFVNDQVVNLIGSKFMTDKRGQKMFMYSKDSLDPGSVGISVSRYFPQLAVAFNTYVQNFKTAGIPDYWRRSLQEQNERTGKNFAKKEKQYAGNTKEDASVRRPVTLGLHVYRYGLVIAVMFFVLEVVFKKFDFLKNICKDCIIIGVPVIQNCILCLWSTFACRKGQEFQGLNKTAFKILKTRLSKSKLRLPRRFE